MFWVLASLYLLIGLVLLRRAMAGAPLYSFKELAYCGPFALFWPVFLGFMAYERVAGDGSMASKVPGAGMHEKLRAFWRERREAVIKRFDRTLPFGDYIVDRWEKAKALGFGEGTSIYDGSLVLGDVKVGKDTWIGPFTILDGSGGLEIGSHCSISAGVQIYTHDTVDWAVSGGDYKRAPTKIGSNCYIGPNTVIAKGVTIGDRCIVGANSFVNCDLPPGSKWAGSPARQLEAV